MFIVVITVINLALISNYLQILQVFDIFFQTQFCWFLMYNIILYL